MAVKDGVTEYPVIQELQQYPHRFSFSQAVNLLESYAAHESTVNIGMNGPCSQESVLFRPYASLGFSSADVKRIDFLPGRDETKSGKFRIEITFMGLYGTVSPIPAFYTEDIVSDVDGESNRRDFMDLFHHRAISIQHRIANKYRLAERLQPGLNDEVANWLFALIGLHGVKRLEKLPLKKLHRLLSNLGLLATQNRSGAMISKIISFYFTHVPVRTEEFVLRDVVIGQEQQVRLGLSQTTLAKDMTIGKTVKDRAGKFRLWIGALSFVRFRDFLPSGKEYAELVALTRYLIQDPLAFDVGLVLQEEEVPSLELDKHQPPQLGWSSWLGKTSAGNKHIIIGRSMTDAHHNGKTRGTSC